MAPRISTLIGLAALFVLAAAYDSVEASVPLGTGNASLLGGDLTDPNDKVVDRGGYGHDLPEEKLRPENAHWLRMKSAPNSPKGTPAHQRHAYQSWQDTPACAIFLNNPEKRKWYVGFKDGGKGGPTEKEPYYCAVEFKEAFLLTHFTITTAPDMPGRDPKVWAIQGSNTGRHDDWTDIYRCKATDRTGSPLHEKPRGETTLFTAFTSAEMEKVVSEKDLKKLRAKLKDRQLDKADFTLPAKPFTWFRIAIFSCFNPNTTAVQDFNRPSGFALGQLELFGVPTKTEQDRPDVPAVQPPTEAKNETPAPVRAPVFDSPFIISYWCGPPRSETTLARYKEIAEAGFNVAMPAIGPRLGAADVAEDNAGTLFDPRQQDKKQRLKVVLALVGVRLR